MKMEGKKGHPDESDATSQRNIHNLNFKEAGGYFLGDQQAVNKRGMNRVTEESGPFEGLFQ